MRALAIVDGEHYPDVVRDALDELPYEFVAVRFVGGSEKLRGAPDYGLPLVDEGTGGAEIAVDLSDEPVLDPRRRLSPPAGVLAAGGPRHPPPLRPLPPA